MIIHTPPTGSTIIQPGTLRYFGGTTAPTGWLICNGAAISRTTYSNLFAIIDEIWGSGDSVTTFNIPSCQGNYLRPADDGRGVASGAILGASLTDRTALPTNPFTGTCSTNGAHTHSGTSTTNGNHTHTVPTDVEEGSNNIFEEDTGTQQSFQTDSAGNHSHSLTVSTTGNHSHGQTSFTSGGDSETGPIGMNLVLIIKT